ncbi:squalene/phytoene synthase family protein [Streptomyces sp. SM13]|uniref:squalene/phytoene synthase family protein n=1 Tax=Streptomyces sp. SM13 TaxID=1983803 RepID=UPI0015E1B3BA|nr:squalene/phytoene synthase family protein [Streptomyces sp. SM13]
MARRDTAAYIAVRSLLAAEHQPHAIAAFVFGTHTDDAADSGPTAEHRRAALSGWSQRTLTALQTQQADSPLLRALLHTLSSREVAPQAVVDVLVGMGRHQHTAGFRNEAAYQQFISDVTLPGTLLTWAPIDAEALQRGPGAWRSLADAIQRLDFLDDLPQDLADGRPMLIHEDLAAYGIDYACLGDASDTDALRAFVQYTCSRISTSLHDARGIIPSTHPSNRRFLKAILISLMARGRSVGRKGAAITCSSSGLGVSSLMRGLLAARS